jgi:hypothetical protein
VTSLENIAKEMGKCFQERLKKDKKAAGGKYICNKNYYEKAFFKI